MQDLEDVLRMCSLAELRLSQGRPREASEAALTAGENAERIVPYFGHRPWRTTAAEAALAMGERERGLALAREATARADRVGVPHQQIRARRLLGMCLQGEAGQQTLRDAVRLGTGAQPRLEHIRALRNAYPKLGIETRRQLPHALRS